MQPSLHSHNSDSPNCPVALSRLSFAFRLASHTCHKRSPLRRRWHSRGTPRIATRPIGPALPHDATERCARPRPEEQPVPTGPESETGHPRRPALPFRSWRVHTSKRFRTVRSRALSAASQRVQEAYRRRQIAKLFHRHLLWPPPSSRSFRTVAESRHSGR